MHTEVLDLDDDGEMRINEGPSYNSQINASSDVWQDHDDMEQDIVLQYLDPPTPQEQAQEDEEEGAPLKRVRPVAPPVPGRVCRL